MIIIFCLVISIVVIYKRKIFYINWLWRLALEILIMDKWDNKGFTLVELIVVIVILVILIGVTIGGITGYVNRARRNTDINNASSIEKNIRF